MREVDVEQLQELLVRARAICELTRVAAHHEVAEALRVLDAVEAKFGAPANKSGPVGTPPITKWFYPNFVVVFENDKVLHAVVVAS